MADPASHGGDDRTSNPWLKRPPGIIGNSIGVIVLLAAIGSGGDDEPDQPVAAPETEATADEADEPTEEPEPDTEPKPEPTLEIDAYDGTVRTGDDARRCPLAGAGASSGAVDRSPMPRVGV